MARKTFSRSFGVEKLEARELKAGDVSVSVSGGELYVSGDNAGNQIEIHQTTGNLYKVTGLNGTEINGKSDRTFRVTGGMHINLKGGNDELQMGGIAFFDDVDGNLDITMGAGLDKVILGKVDVTGTTTINTDADADQITLGNFGNYQNMNINTGTGDDKVIAALVTTKNLTIDTAAGKDTTDLFVVVAKGAMNLKGGSEDDLMKVANGQADNGLKIDSAAGNDDVQISGLIQASLIDVKTGTENDDVLLDGVTATNKVTIDTLDGIDTVQVLDSQLDKLLDIRTGLGNDEVTINEVVAKAGIKIDTAAGEDEVTLVDVTATNQDITINTGGDDDFVKITRVVADDLFAKLGDDDDRIDIADSIFDLVDIDGEGGGDDFFDLGGNDFGSLVLNSIDA